MTFSGSPVRARRGIVVAAALGLALGLAGCSAGEDPAASPAAADSQPSASASPSAQSDVKVVQPGRPGEGTKTVDPDTLRGDPQWNSADVAFMQMMVPHHAQALRMSELAETRASDAQVKALAERIKAAQGPEIRLMASWLAERKLEVPGADDHGDHAGHDAEAMMGMLTPAQMRQLAAAEGDGFDRLFLRGMIQHHQGAVDMAGDAAAAGVDIQVSELAADVNVSQSAEIARMETLLAGL